MVLSKVSETYILVNREDKVVHKFEVLSQQHF